MHMTPLAACTAYRKLHENGAGLRGTHLREQLQDEERNKRMMLQACGVTFDFSRQVMSVDVVENLLLLATERDVPCKVAAMFAGEKINQTENRAVLHTALRAPADAEILVDSVNVVPAVHNVLNAINAFSEGIRNGTRRGFTGKPLTDVICIGIGGSYLGSEYVFEALKTEQEAAAASKGRRLHFLANVDPIDVKRVLDGFTPETTLIIIISKTFTTAETMLNARTVRHWVLEALKDPASIAKHFVAVSTNLAETSKFGIAPGNVFGFWDWVGGRYSVTSAVGVLPLALQYGFPIVQKFLEGCRAMDEHFRDTAPSLNMPMMMGLIAHWNRVYLDHRCLAVLPYCQALHKFTAHVQQLNMESNGKGVAMDGSTLPYSSGPVIFGEPGTNGQHSFYQLLHQGQVVPSEFIGFTRSQNPLVLPGEVVSNHDELMSNFFAQPDALALGKTAEELKAEKVPEEHINHKCFYGNRPSSVLLFPICDAYNCGLLLSLYEHRTAVEGFLLDVNSFDQWGVELGKVLAKSVRSLLHASRTGDEETAKSVEASLPQPTRVLLQQYFTDS